MNYRSDDLDTTFAALVDPTRRAILARLSRRPELTLGEIAAPLPIQLPAVIKHVSILCDAGLVTREKVGRTVYCRLAPQGLRRAARWLEQTAAFWESRLDNLSALLEDKQ